MVIKYWIKWSEELNDKELKGELAKVTRCQDWSSWLYNLVSNLLLFTFYGITWIESASNIYIYLIYFENFVILQIIS